MANVCRNRWGVQSGTSASARRTANAAASSAAAFRDDLALRRRALAAGALPPLPSPADVVDYSEGVGGDDYDYGGGEGE